MLTDINTKGIVYAVIATVTLVVLLALLRLIFKRLGTRVETALAHSNWAFQIQRLELLSADGFKRGAMWIIRIIHTLSVLILIYLYIPVVLKLLPWTEPLAQPFIDYFMKPITQVWEAIVNYIPSLFDILVIVFFTWLFLKLLRVLFFCDPSRLYHLPGFSCGMGETNIQDH